MSALRAASAALVAIALAALVLMVRVLVAGPVTAGTVLAVTPLRAVLLLFLSVLGAVVASYAARNLVGQHRLGRFAALEVLLVGGLGLAVAAATLPVLLVGWVLAGAAVALLVSHAGTPRARRAAGAVAARLAVGDLALALAVVLVAVWWGRVEIAGLGAVVATAPVWQVAVVAGLVLLGGAVRSALVPFHRWLPETAEAPSPVSAVLHAGVVNGVGILALLLWPLVAASPVARGAVLVLGAATVVLGTFQQRVRPDVKGRLVSSTSSQMGYLAVTVGLGLPAAVLVHLMGHGLWKASLFLGAGGAVERARTARGVHVDRHPAAAPLAAAAAAAVVVAGAGIPTPWPSLLAGPALLLPVVVAALAAGVAGFAAVRHARGSAVLSLGLVLVAAAAYPLVVRAVDAALEPVLAWATPAWGEPGAAGLALVVAVLLLVGLGTWYADRRAASGRAPRLVSAVARGTLSAPRAGRRVAVVEQPEGRADRAIVEAAVPVAADVVSPLWPLHAFVASNPLAGLEHLPFADALRASHAGWGTGDLVDAALLRAAYADGVVTDAALDAVAAEVAPGGDLPVPVALRSRRELVRALLLRDDAVSAQTEAVRGALCTTRSARPGRVLTPGERAAGAEPRAAIVDERARDLVSSYAARVLGTTAWSQPAGSVWGSVRGDAASLDRLLGTRGAGDLVSSLPGEPVDALAAVVGRLRLRREEVVPHLSRLLARDPGWPAHIRWRARVGVGPEGELVDLLAARAVLDAVVAATAPAPAPEQPVEDLAPLVAAMLDAAGLLVGSVSPAVLGELLRIAESVDDEGLGLLRLRVWEASYRGPLLAQVGARARELADLGAVDAGRDAQVVTCIDVRSERLRRHLEAVGPWETLGAAGFFGLPLCHVSPSGAVTERLPALIRPQHVVTETAPERGGQWLLGDAAEAVHGVEAQAGAPFALAEAAGWVSGPLALLHTLRPRTFGRIGAGVASAVGDATRGRLDVCDTPAGGFSLDELVDAAEGFLRSTGLLSPAPLVVLVGHQGHAANNPHLAAYDCGACGGQAGDVSARAMAAVLNDARVREGLRSKGIEIPARTWFVGGLHDTTRDVVTVLDEVPDHLREIAARLDADLAAACDRVIEERAARLPGLVGDGAAALRRRAEGAAVDWANPRPEWGLVGNAALVIGPRSLTEGLDLDGRVFLHSYRHDLDHDGSALEQLLTAPLVVAQWISTQYLCSTLEPERFGAGDKTTHNVVASHDGSPAPLTGVLTGARGDLRIGLPWQGLSSTAPVDGRWVGCPVHEPVRLLAVVHARPEKVDAVLAAHPEVARLVLGEWVSLVVVDPASGRLHRLDAERGWVVEDAERAVDVRQDSDRDDSVNV